MEIHQQLCLSGSVCTSPPGTHYIFQLFELVKKNSKQTVWKNMCVCALHSCIPPNNGCLFFFFFVFTQDRRMQHSSGALEKPNLFMKNMIIIQ